MIWSYAGMFVSMNIEKAPAIGKLSSIHLRTLAYSTTSVLKFPIFFFLGLYSVLKSRVFPCAGWTRATEDSLRGSTYIYKNN